MICHAMPWQQRIWSLRSQKKYIWKIDLGEMHKSYYGYGGRTAEAAANQTKTSMFHSVK